MISIPASTRLWVSDFGVARAMPKNSRRLPLQVGQVQQSLISGEEQICQASVATSLSLLSPVCCLSVQLDSELFARFQDASQKSTSVLRTVRFYPLFSHLLTRVIRFILVECVDILSECVVVRRDGWLVMDLEWQLWCSETTHLSLLMAVPNDGTADHTDCELGSITVVFS